MTIGGSSVAPHERARDRTVSGGAKLAGATRTNSSPRVAGECREPRHAASLVAASCRRVSCDGLRKTS